MTGIEVKSQGWIDTRGLLKVFEDGSILLRFSIGSGRLRKRGPSHCLRRRFASLRLMRIVSIIMRRIWSLKL